MPGSITRREPDLFRRYWWVFFILILGVAGLVSWPVVRSALRESAMEDRQLAAKEQSLSVLDGPGQKATTSGQQTAGGQASGGPGSATAAAGPQSPAETGPYAHKEKNIYDPTNAMYEPPAETAQAPGAPLGAGSKQGSNQTNQKAENAGGNLAAALANVANAGKRPDARAYPNNYASASSFTAPHANFGAMNGLGNGTASSPASYEAPGVTPFGIGKSNPTFAAPAAGLPSAEVGAYRAHTSGGGAMAALQNANAQATAAAWSANSDAAAGMSGRSYDMSSIKPNLNANVPHSGITMGDGKSVVADLKQNDPALADKKDVQPPAPANVQPTDGGSSQIMGMIMQIAIGGLLGPMLLGNGAGGGLLGGL